MQSIKRTPWNLARLAELLQAVQDGHVVFGKVRGDANPTNSLTKIPTTAANAADLAFLNNAGGAPLVVSPVEGTAAAMAYEVLDHAELVAALRAVLRAA